MIRIFVIVRCLARLLEEKRDRCGSLHNLGRPREWTIPLSQRVERLGVVREDFLFDRGVDAFHALELVERSDRARWIGVAVVGADH